MPVNSEDVMKANRNCGFTLIELLFVVTIIAEHGAERNECPRQQHIEPPVP